MTATASHPIPHNLVAEKSVLGAVLLDEQHLHALLVDEQLRPEHFYLREHGAVFQAMLELYEADKKIDHLTVAEQLRDNNRLDEIGGADVVEELVAWVPSTGHARDYGRIVREQAQMRALLDATREIQADVMNRVASPRELVEQAERAMLEVAHDERQKAIRSIAEVLHEETDRLHLRSNQKSPLTGTPSGFRDLDDMTGGFQAGNLIVLAARPSMGKSALVANIAAAALWPPRSRSASPTRRIRRTRAAPGTTFRAACRTAPNTSPHPTGSAAACGPPRGTQNRDGPIRSAVAVRIATGEQCATRRRALLSGGVRGGEQDALGGQPIQARARHPLGARTRRATPGVVPVHDQQVVVAPLRHAQQACRSGGRICWVCPGLRRDGRRPGQPRRCGLSEGPERRAEQERAH